MKIFLLMIFCCLGIVSNAQTAPDDSKIELEIRNPESKFYYPNLFMRYSSGDLTLTQEDYRYLYYGFAFQSEYRPLENNTAADNLLLVFDDRELNEEQKTASALKYALQSFHFDPFSLSNINFLTYLYGLLGDEKNEKINADRLDKLILTISNSGSGMEENSPWHVLYFNHASDMIALLGEQTGDRMVVSRTTEFFPLIKRRGDFRGYYFNYARAYSKKPEGKQREKRSSGFEINGYNIR